MGLQSPWEIAFFSATESWTLAFGYRRYGRPILATYQLIVVFRNMLGRNIESTIIGNRSLICNYKILARCRIKFVARFVQIRYNSE